MIIKHNVDPETGEQSLWFICPGCEGAGVGTGLHRLPMPPWGWDGNLEAPTVEGSVLTKTSDPAFVCHSFIRAGSIEFLNDSTHELAGTTVPLPPLPGWFLGEKKDDE